MQNDIAISVEHLSKRYMIGGKQRQWSIRDTVEEFLRHPFGIGAERHDKEEFWALNDVSFEIKKGDVVGIIGRNGSGKSTLLKILTRIVEPTKGKITMRGRVASLLEVGTGFNAELTGRENIFLNGAILGMSQKEIAGKFDEIVAFSGVEQFIDTPVKRYSSGMYVRLAFAVAAHLDSDILLVDEVLAVGDAEFQKKCLGKMDSLAKSGKTVLFVSHDMRSIKQMCNLAIYLTAGVVVKYGRTNKVVEAYINPEEHVVTSLVTSLPNTSLISEVEFIPSEKSAWLSSAEPFCISLKHRQDEHMSNYLIGVEFYSMDGQILFFTSDCDLRTSFPKRDKGEYVSTVEIPSNTLNPGSYEIRVSIQSPGKELYEYVRDIFFTLECDESDFRNKMFEGKRFGYFSPLLSWTQKKRLL